MVALSVVIRGGGDLASGVALRCSRAGWRVFVLELDQPLAVRRSVSFAQAVYDGSIQIEGTEGCFAPDVAAASDQADRGIVSVLIDPEMEKLIRLRPDVLVDARMLKREARFIRPPASFIIGLGPGFIVGLNCDAVIETKRGPNLGRVYWTGAADEDTGLPDPVGAYKEERVIRAPLDGVVEGIAKIGDRLQSGMPILKIGGQVVLAPFDGVLRGIIQNGVRVKEKMKIGDLDPRNDVDLCFRVSDKALSIGGGVLEAILSRTELRQKMWG